MACAGPRSSDVMVVCVWRLAERDRNRLVVVATAFLSEATLAARDDQLWSVYDVAKALRVKSQVTSECVNM